MTDVEWKPTPTPEWDGCKVVLLGLARSGLAAGALLWRRGAEIYCVDDNLTQVFAPDFEPILLTSAPDRSLLDGAGCLVLSPGVPRTHSLVQAALQRGVPVWSELEIGFRESTSPVIAVTGSKGKSTTAAWIHHLLQGLGVPATLAGNIGVPYTSVVDRYGPEDWMVLEVSSFQLESVEAFHAHVAVHLQVSPDHLDRYPSFEAYAASKARIAGLQEPGDWLVVDPRDTWSRKLAGSVRSQVVGFGERWRGLGVAAEGEDLVWRDRHTRTVLAALADVPLLGAHNQSNAMAALAVCCATGAWKPEGRQALRSFRGLEFRMQVCGTKNGVRVVNDAKSTTVDSVRAALRGLDVPVVLALGGRNKGLDFGPLRSALLRVRAVIVYGEDAEAIAAALEGAARIERVPPSLEAVVACGLEIAEPGDTFLFSPGCTSFDMFRNAEERGEAFTAAVRRAGVEEKA